MTNAAQFDIWHRLTDLDPASAPRFIAKVAVPDSNGCWLWQAARIRNGYGQFWFIDRMVKPHRWLFQVLNGPTHLMVLHRCDIRACVNPTDLYLGTNSDNMQDRNGKGRQARLRGSRNGMARLTDEEVRDIRTVVHTRTLKSVAEQYGVSLQTIWRIRHNQRYLGAD